MNGVKDKVENGHTRILGIEFAPAHIPLTRRIQTIAAASWFMILFGTPTISFMISCYIILFTQYYWLMLLYLLWIYIDRYTCEKGGRRINWMRSWTLWKYFHDYFPLKLVTVDGFEMDPKRNYLLCSYPHGLLATGIFCNFGTETEDYKKLFPKMTATTLTLSVHFFIPFFREFLFGLGFCSVSKESINYLLSRPEGGNLALVVLGGATESFYCRPGNNTIVLKNRKGFVRLALKNGAPLVPVYSFGETDLYDQVESPKGSFLHLVQEKIHKITGIAPIIPVGRGFFQYTFGFIPKRSPIVTVVGKPIEVPKIPIPTDDDVERIHKIFEREITNLFNSEKHKYLKNSEKAELVII